MTELLKCPICDNPLQPDDLCASDIEMGACHAECLEGSPVVDLDTGKETPGAKVDTFRAREIMEPDRQQRDKFEAAVVKRLQESGFLEVEIRTECLARVGQGYQDEVINAGWHYWNEALWQNIPLVDPGFGRGPDGLDFATPDEVFDKGPQAVREWQEARGRKPQTPPPQTHVEGEWLPIITVPTDGRKIEVRLPSGKVSTAYANAEARQTLQMAYTGWRDIALPQAMEEIHQEQLDRPRLKPAPSQHLRVTNPATISDFVRTLSDHGVKLPLLEDDGDIGTLVDANGKPVLVVDVNRERSDEDVAWIRGMIQVAVNTCGGFKAQRRDTTEGQDNG